MTMLEETDEAWMDRLERFGEWLDEGELERAVEELAGLPFEEQRLVFSRLSQAHQVLLIDSVEPEFGGRLLELLPQVQGAGLLEGATPEKAALITTELGDQDSAELIRLMDSDRANLVLDHIEDQEEADRIREISSYDPESAGGIMTEHVASFEEDATVGDVLRELNTNASHYGDMDVQYVYIVDRNRKLRGVLPLRDLILTPPGRAVSDVMIPEPYFVLDSDELDRLITVFDEQSYFGLPVVDADGVLKGVISARDVKEAAVDHQADDYRRAAGIVGGEELRSMPIGLRSLRRLSWLAPNIVLNLIAASVIAMYEDTLQAVIALAVFLPIVSDMSGCSGNQAVAVSIRELALGLIRPNEFVRIFWKEGLVGLINGLILGILLGSIAALWKANVYLGLVIGGALFFNTILSVLLGGCVPLLLKKFRVDPALASGPILTTCTDMCGFFLVLNLASVMLSKLV